jgi:hypothetical protein
MAMKTRIVRNATIVMLLLCGGISRAEQLPNGISNEFYWMPQAQRDAKFEKYDFDAQYKIYIYGCQVIEPPALGLARPLARRGASIVQPLESKLNRANDDLTIRDIVYLFLQMNNWSTYDVLDDQQLMDDLKLKVSEMKDSAWRIIAEEQLDAIREKKADKGS